MHEFIAGLEFTLALAVGSLAGPLFSATLLANGRSATQVLTAVLPIVVACGACLTLIQRSVSRQGFFVARTSDLVVGGFKGSRAPRGQLTVMGEKWPTRRATESLRGREASLFFRRMNVATTIHRLIALVPVVLLPGCGHTPPHLPSRPTWEMYPRASSPPPECPGQYRSVIEDAGGSFFLGCWGQTTD